MHFGDAEALRRQVDLGGTSEAVAAFYRARDCRPLWTLGDRVRPEAGRVAALIARPADDGLDPADYHAAAVALALDAAASGDRAALARAELAVSSAYAAYISDLHRPPPEARMAFWDPALAPAEVSPLAALQAAAAAPNLATGIAAATRMHPIYEGLRSELRARRELQGATAPLAPLILANMARARALPAAPGRRYILVDAAAQQLWVYEDGRSVDSMRVIVGTRNGATPPLAGLIRYASFRPYWNIPPDIVRDEIAPHVLRDPDYPSRERLEILSDGSPTARMLDPASVDWAAVASGAVTVRVRTLPGGRNILGQVKLMLPNPLGIYLHDTPNKQPFARAQRLLSHGCIRLQDAMRLTRRLVGRVADDPPPGDDVRVDLPDPTPVYVTYFTLVPGPAGLERRPDVYGRDPSLLAAIAARGSAQAARRLPDHA